MNKKKPNATDERVLGSAARRSGRTLITTDTYNDILEEFMWQRSRKTAEIEKGELSLLKDYELPFKVTPYETDHSVYGSVGYILEGDHSIAYTGDIRLHGARKQKSYDFIEGAKGSDILIIEGTRLTGENIIEKTSNSIYRDYII